MNDPKKQQPVAVCTECGAYGYSVRNIGERCGKPYGGRRCAGVRARATDPTNWKECLLCGATGHHEGEECRLCVGTGWIHVQRRTPEAA